MDKNLIKEELQELINIGNDIVENLLKKEKTEISTLYQSWYSTAAETVKKLLPNRYDEFVGCYLKKKNSNHNLADYSIQEYMQNIIYKRYDEATTIWLAKSLIKNQLDILKSLSYYLNSKIVNIGNELLYELNKTEIETAKKLAKVSLRASGCICGVILEGHLKKVLKKYVPNDTTKDKDLTLNRLNELLYANNTYDLRVMKKVDYLGSIRNICDHNKKDDITGSNIEPTKENISSLINGVEEIMATIN